MAFVIPFSLPGMSWISLPIKNFRSISSVGTTKCPYPIKIAGKSSWDFIGIDSWDWTSYNPYRFTGQQWDEDSEFYYLRARYYDPSTGRFISRDPFRGFLSDSQSQNPYVYCKGNPIFYYDPSGYGNEGLPGNPGGPFEPFRFPPDINKPRDCPPKFPAERFKIPREDVRPLQPKPPGPWKYTRIPEHPVHQTWPPIEPEPGPRLSLPAPPKPLPAPPPVANPIIHVVAQGAIGGLIIFTFTQFFVPHPWAEQQSPTPMPGVRP